jgi:hypothetical protein
MGVLCRFASFVRDGGMGVSWMTESVRDDVMARCACPWFCWVWMKRV